MDSCQHAHVEYFLSMLRSGNVEQAYFGLIEANVDALPYLKEAYEQEADAEVKAILLEAIWQHRDASVLSLLEQALASSDAPVWKAALDGLVALASSESVGVLNDARKATRDSNKLEWIDEALDQIKERLK